MSGVSTLFTPEFYRQAKRALSANGLFIQRFHIYEIDRPLVASIVRAIGEVFPDYVLYAPNDGDVILVATASGSLPSPANALFGWPAMRAELDYLGIRGAADLGIFRIANRRAYAPLLEAGRANSDYYPLLEFGAPRARFANARFTDLSQNARDPIPILEILSGFGPPELPPPSVVLARINSRFIDVCRAGVFAGVLTADRAVSDADAVLLLEGDRENLDIVRAVPAAGAANAWHTWFASLYALSKILVPNGGGPALERYVRSERVGGGLRGAPQDVRDKVAFLLLVSSRDLDGMRREGPRLLAGSLVQLDPGFAAYVLFSTTTACPASGPDPSCQRILEQFDRLPIRSPVFEVLRAHRAASH